MLYNAISYDEMMEGVLAYYRGKYDVQEGSFLYELVSQLIYQIWGYYDALDAIEDMTFVNEDSGEYIDRRAAEYGITRKSGTKAKVTLTFSGEVGAEIDAGAEVEDDKGNVFSTDAAAAIGGGGVCSVPATCTEPGAAGNVAAGTIAYFASDIVGVDEVTNEGKAEGGTDEETDAELMARLDAFRKRPATSGNAYSYEQWATEVDGIGYAIVRPLASGAGTVNVYVASSAKRAVTPEKAAEVAAHIETMRPIGATVTVESVTETEIDITVKIKRSGEKTLAEITDAISASVTAYIENLGITEREIKINAIGAIVMDVDGVEDYKDLTLCGGTTNVTLAENGIPVPGEVTTSEYV